MSPWHPLLTHPPPLTTPHPTHRKADLLFQDTVAHHLEEMVAEGEMVAKPHEATLGSGQWGDVYVQWDAQGGGTGRVAPTWQKSWWLSSETSRRQQQSD